LCAFPCGAVKSAQDGNAAVNCSLHVGLPLRAFVILLVAVAGGDGVNGFKQVWCSSYQARPFALVGGDVNMGDALVTG
jgi:hypothetical protein